MVEPPAVTGTTTGQNRPATPGERKQSQVGRPASNTGPRDERAGFKSSPLRDVKTGRIVTI